VGKALAQHNSYNMPPPSADHLSPQEVLELGEFTLQNTFKDSHWGGTNQPTWYIGECWPPTSVEDLLGHPSKEEECAVCLSRDTCQCSYKAWIDKMQLFWMRNIHVSPTPGKGYGIFARSDFEEGQVIGEYTGELMPIDHTRSNKDTQYVATIPIGKLKVTQKGTLALRQAQCWIDGARCGSVFRFLNHSCDCNAELIQGRIGMNRRVLMVMANRPITAGEELTLDYGSTYFQPGEHCQCGSKACRFPVNAGL
jgi:SET domain-containing protein